MDYNFLHNHPMKEKSLKLDRGHVIIDRKDWEEARNRFLLRKKSKKSFWKFLMQNKITLTFLLLYSFWMVYSSIIAILSWF